MFKFIILLMVLNIFFFLIFFALSLFIKASIKTTMLCHPLHV